MSAEILDDEFNLVPGKGAKDMEDPDHPSHISDQGTLEANLEPTGLEECSNPYVTDELEPSLANKIIRVFRNFIFFPTRIRVIASLLTFFWLVYCFSMITFGLKNDHYCPANPRLSDTIALHGVFWVLTSAYVIFRLVWSEITVTNQPTCTVYFLGQGKLKWPKEVTYGIDAAVALLLFTSYLTNLGNLIKLEMQDPVLHRATHRNWLTTCYAFADPPNNCCREFVVRYAVSQQVISYIAMCLLGLCYLYVIGFLDVVRSRICVRDIARTQEENYRLV